MKRALITGIGGQDGSFLAEMLLSKGYEVFGIELPSLKTEGNRAFPNLSSVSDKVQIRFGSLVDNDFITKTFYEIIPDECYHLAASSFVSFRFQDEKSILQNNLHSTHNVLASLVNGVPGCRMFFAGSSEMFGTADHYPQNEETIFNPRSIYGISKVSGHHLVKYYREQHGLFACTGFLYNHESSRRGLNFVTRKISSTAAKIKLGQENELSLGNLNVLRDWGYAPDFVKGMWQMLQAEQPKDYVLASGELHSVLYFVKTAFDHLGLNYLDYVRTDPKYFREAEAIPLCGDPGKAIRELGWKNSKSLKEIIEEMVENDLKTYGE